VTPAGVTTNDIFIMEKIRVLIVDDEPIAHEGLRTLLTPERDVEIIGENRNGREAIQAIREQKPDLVLLDVQMPKMNGFNGIKLNSSRRYRAKLDIILNGYKIINTNRLWYPFPSKVVKKVREQLVEKPWARRIDYVAKGRYYSRADRGIGSISHRRGGESTIDRPDALDRLRWLGDFFCFAQFLGSLSGGSHRTIGCLYGSVAALVEQSVENDKRVD
jgi:hypothetical protein